MTPSTPASTSTAAAAAAAPTPDPDTDHYNSPTLLSSSFFNSSSFQNHGLNLRKSIIFSPSMDSVRVGPLNAEEQEEEEVHEGLETHEEVQEPDEEDTKQEKPQTADADTTVNSHSDSVKSTASPLRLKKKSALDKTIELKMTNSPSFQGLADMLESKVKRYESSSNIKMLSQLSKESTPVSSPTSSKFTATTAHNYNASPTPSPLKKIPSLEIDNLLPVEDTPKVYQSAIMNPMLSPPQITLTQPLATNSPNLIQLSDSPLPPPPSSSFATNINKIPTSRFENVVSSSAFNDENDDIFGTPKITQQPSTSSKTGNGMLFESEALEVENIPTPVIPAGSNEEPPLRKAPPPTTSTSTKDTSKQRSASLPVIPSKQKPTAAVEPVKKKKGFMSFFKSNKRVASLQVVPSSKSSSNLSSVNDKSKTLRQSQSFSVDKAIGSKKESPLAAASTTARAVEERPHVAKRSTSSTSLFSAFRRKSKLIDAQTLTELADVEKKVESNTTESKDLPTDQNSDDDEDSDEEYDEPKQRTTTTTAAAAAAAADESNEFNEDFNELRLTTTPKSHQTATFSNNLLVSPRSIRSRSSVIDQGETLFPKSLNAQEVESIVSIERSRSFNRSIRSKRGSTGARASYGQQQQQQQQQYSSLMGTMNQAGSVSTNATSSTFGAGLLTNEYDSNDDFVVNFDDEGYDDEFGHIFDQMNFDDDIPQQQQHQQQHQGGQASEDEDDYKQFIEFADIINFGNSDMDLGLNYDSPVTSPVVNQGSSAQFDANHNQNVMFNYSANYQESPVLGQQVEQFHQSSPLIPDNFDDEDDDDDSFHIGQTPKIQNYQKFNEQEEQDIYHQPPVSQAQSTASATNYSHSDSSFTSANNSNDHQYEHSPLTSPFLQQTSFTDYTPHPQPSMFDPTQPPPALLASQGPRMVRPISMSFRGLKSPAFNTPYSIPPPSLGSTTPTSSVASSPVRSGYSHRTRGVKFSNKLTIFETYHEDEYDRHPDLATCNELNPQLAIMIKNELNELKSEMEVHLESRCYTHFF